MLSNKEIGIISYSTDKERDVNVYYYLALDIGKTNKFIKEEDKEHLVWKDIDDVYNTLSYDNLKELWNNTKIYVEEFLNNNKI